MPSEEFIMQYGWVAWLRQTRESLAQRVEVEDRREMSG